MEQELTKSQSRVKAAQAANVSPDPDFARLLSSIPSHDKPLVHTGLEIQLNSLFNFKFEFTVPQSRLPEPVVKTVKTPAKDSKDSLGELSEQVSLASVHL